MSFPKEVVSHKYGHIHSEEEGLYTTNAHMFILMAYYLQNRLYLILKYLRKIFIGSEKPEYCPSRNSGC